MKCSEEVKYVVFVTVAIVSILKFQSCSLPDMCMFLMVPQPPTQTGTKENQMTLMEKTVHQLHLYTNLSGMMLPAQQSMHSSVKESES